MLEGFPACRIAFDSMAEVACEAAKVAYKEKLGDLQSASVEEKPGIVSSLGALGLQLETMGWLPSKHPLTEELSFVRSIPAAQEPGDMVYKYWQSSLLEKIATSNF